MATEAGKILRAGGLVGVGSHGQLQGLGYHWELWALESGDLTPHEALRAATIVGAEVIGFSDDLGSIEPGKMADMVILDGNPLEDIRNTNTVHWVMKNGEIFEGDTLDQVWPIERELAIHPARIPVANEGSVDTLIKPLVLVGIFRDERCDEVGAVAVEEVDGVSHVVDDFQGYFRSLLPLPFVAQTIFGDGLGL